MKKISFRKHHILKIFAKFSNQPIAFDRLLANYFFQNKSLGSHDRKYIYETSYYLIRNKGLIDHFLTSPVTWEKRMDFFEKNTLQKCFVDEDIPLHIRYSFPKPFFMLLLQAYGQEKTETILQVLNTSAPITIRVNALKTTRDALFEKWKNTYETEKCSHSPYGITFKKRYSLFSIPEFKQGFFEMQDEASQLVAQQVCPKEGDLVLDLCSGSGGKALAIATNMKNTGQIFLHDIRKNILYEARKRMKRAGVENYQLVFPEERKEKLRLQQMDWVLLDVPCSGSGTLRRCPEMKWKWHMEDFQNQIKLQREIFKMGLSYLKKSGKIVYATCSIFAEENENQVKYFLSKYPLILINTFKILPKINEMDGFYSATFQYRT